jgi:hypothetical protein
MKKGGRVTAAGVRASRDKGSLTDAAFRRDLEDFVVIFVASWPSCRPKANRDHECGVTVKSVANGSVTAATQAHNRAAGFALRP